jgi:hypothetical protein
MTGQRFTWCGGEPEGQDVLTLFDCSPPVYPQDILEWIGHVPIVALHQPELNRRAAAVTDCGFGLVGGGGWTELAKEARGHSLFAPTPAPLSNLTTVRLRTRL